MIRIFKTSLSSSSDSPEVLTAELGQQTSPGRRGIGRKSSGHRSPGGGASLLSNKRLTLPFLALLAVLAAGLLFLMPGGLLQAQDSSTIEYMEKGTGPVLTLSASDPEDAMPITWSLPASGADPDGIGGPLADTDAQDNDLFKIDPRSGVLEFRISPNYESPADEGDNNSYNVVVQASDGDTGDPMDTRSWFKVTVNVSDVEEEGSIVLRPTPQTATTLLQPQIGVQITASGLMDGDGTSANRAVSAITGATYQWYRTTSMSAMGTAISGGTSAAYTPIHLQGSNSDIGKYLRVVSTYADGRGAGKTATAVSMYKTIRRIGDNQSPSFTDGDATTRAVREDAKKGVNVGFPVTATDPESGDDEQLTYWLTGDDADMFSIEAATGQLKTDDGLDRETAATHTVIVHVTDSSGDTTNNEDMITVTINVLQADEKPTVTGASTIELTENETDLDDTDAAAAAGDDDVYAAADPEGGAITFSLGGADKDLFKLSDLPTAVTGSRVLAFKENPDFEKPMDVNGDNVYEVMVQASDDANTGMRAVTVKVTNVQEDGEVKVMPTQPRIGVELTAELTDSDIVAYGPMWQWERALDCDGDPPAWMNISGATSATFTPRSSDLDYCLRAVATYNDEFHEGTADATTGIYPDTAGPNRFDKTANMELSAVQYPSDNIAPRFASAMTKRFVPENAAAGNDIGEPVTAVDPNGADDLVAGGYSLSGADQGSFSINSGTGQLMTGMRFNHENKEMYTVTVTATDSFGATASIRVNIYVGDVDEAAEETGTTMATNTIEYVEKGTGPVLTLSASDPEDAMPITWSLPASGADPDGIGGPLADTDAQDNDLFKIDPRSGVLEFRISPNYESPADEGDNNSYNVVVQASDGDMGDPMDTRSWFKVIVNVSDVEEEGSIVLRPTPQTATTLLQPQIGVQITASGLMDGDGTSANRAVSAITGATYQWYRMTNMSAMGTAISGGTSAAYTPIHLQGSNSDIGKYLRVVATYADGKGTDKTATAVSMYKTIRGIGDNRSPSFTDGDATIRAVREDAKKGVNVGFPVTATDPESGDDEQLTYWLTGDDADMFSIEAATGQLKTDDGLDRETAATHTVIVHVTDSSGDTTNNEDMITVTINVLQADEKPTVTGASTIELTENETDLDDTDAAAAAGDDDVYAAADPEGGAITFSLGGADKDLFKLSDLPTAVTGSRVLAFKENPDFEKPMDVNGDNVYEVMVQASDDANTGMRAVTVKVTNVQEDGEVKVMPTQPRIGVELTAELTDSDIVAYGPMWQWERALDCDGDPPAWMNISGATSATFTPRSSDLDYCLRAVATYNDEFHEGTADATTGIYPDTAGPNRFDKTANMELSAVQYPSDNIAPRFASAMTKRFVPENAAAGNDIGEPVTAVDPNGADDLVAGGYSLSGADQGSFSINSGTGQLMTGMRFNHENKEMYTVTVTATDSFGATASIRVNIYVGDVDEAAPIMEGGLSVSGPASMDYAEGGMDAVATYTASGPMADRATWSLEGDDAGDFMIGSDGRLKFRSMPDYEMPADADMDNMYMVTVKASDGTYTAMKAVTVRVSNEEEDGTVTLSPMTPVVGTDVTATLKDPDTVMEDSVTWQWSKSMTMDGEYMDIDGATSMSYTPVEDDDGYYLMAKAMYTDGYGGDMAMAKTSRMVTAVQDQPGTVSLSPMTPVVGVELTASLSDADGSVTEETWMWSRSMTMGGTFMDIAGATSMSYTPVAADEDYYLRATVTYTDGHGSGKTEMATTTAAVTAGDPLVIRYDINPPNGMIDKAEVIAAITEYLYGTGDAAITKDEVIKLITLYLYGS